MKFFVDTAKIEDIKKANEMCGDIINHFSGFEKIKYQKPQSRKKSYHRYKVQCLLRAGSNPHCRQCRSHNSCRCRIYSKNKLWRGGKQSKKQNRKNRAIQPIHSRNPCHFRIPHRNRNGNRCNNDSS